VFGEVGPGEGEIAIEDALAESVHEGFEEEEVMDGGEGRPEDFADLEQVMYVRA
jgi:hypothetical protein